jgi:hypothetical protein
MSPSFDATMIFRPWLQSRPLAFQALRILLSTAMIIIQPLSSIVELDIACGEFRLNAIGDTEVG